MSETFGFFEAMWDKEALNPETEAYTGWWDTAYLWADFMNYFSLFVGNGVFVSPGWAFINGHWYHNDMDKVLMVPVNNTPSTRIDSVKVRLSLANREITAIEFMDDTSVSRGDNTYELKLAEIMVYPGVMAISNANIIDTRGDSEVCGFVKGLLEVVDTKDLFLQFEAIFNNWFDTVKDQVTGDLAIRLQQEFEQINQDLVNFYNQVREDIKNYKEEIENIAQDAYDTMNDFVSRDFVIPLNSYYFTENKCIIVNSIITEDTLVDVYWTKESMSEAIRCSIYVDSEEGAIVLTAGRQPSVPLSAVIRVRVR